MAHELTHVTFSYLWIMKECILMVDTSTCCPSPPFSMKKTFMPSFLQTKQFGIHLTTDADISKPSSPVMQLHPEDKCISYNYTMHTHLSQECCDLHVSGGWHTCSIMRTYQNSPSSSTFSPSFSLSLDGTLFHSSELQQNIPYSRKFCMVQAFVFLTDRSNAAIIRTAKL